MSDSSNRSGMRTKSNRRHFYYMWTIFVLRIGPQVGGPTNGGKVDGDLIESDKIGGINTS